MTVMQDCGDGFGDHESSWEVAPSGSWTVNPLAINQIEGISSKAARGEQGDEPSALGDIGDAVHIEDRSHCRQHLNTDTVAAGGFRLAASPETRTTLVFVDDIVQWLIAHEHHSPFPVNTCEDAAQQPWADPALGGPCRALQAQGLAFGG
jgi:hypothetical protein